MVQQGIKWPVVRMVSQCSQSRGICWLDLCQGQWVKGSGYFRNSNGNYSGLEAHSILARMIQRAIRKYVSPGALWSSAGFTLDCEHHGITSNKASTVARRKQGVPMLWSGSKAVTRMALAIPWTQFTTCGPQQLFLPFTKQWLKAEAKHSSSPHFSFLQLPLQHKQIKNWI